MPDGTIADYEAKQEFDFPVGTIISKTFHYRKGGDWRAASLHVVATEPGEQTSVVPPLMLDEYVLIETRLLVRYADGWHGFPYVWNAAQTDATLRVRSNIGANTNCCKTRQRRSELRHLPGSAG